MQQISMAHFGNLSSDQARRVKAAQSQLIEVFQMLQERGVSLPEANYEALELQSWRNTGLRLVQDGKLTMEELNTILIEEKAKEMEKQYQQFCTRNAQQREESGTLLVFPQK